MKSTAMAIKTNKARKEKVGNGNKPNLPERLHNSVDRPYINHIASPGTIKSWLTASRRCNGSKQLPYPQLTELTDFTCITINHCYIWSLSDILKWNPPPVRNANIPFKFASSSCSLTRTYDPTVLVVTGVSNPSFMFFTWKGRESRWITHASSTIDPYDAKNRFMEFTNVIGADGKFYALSSQGSLVILEVNDDRVSITGTCRRRAVPSSMNAKYFKEYLLESSGEILLVFLVYQKSLSLVDEVEVFRFDRPELIKVERLQGRALFLDNNYCISVNTREIGCKGDCVYFKGRFGDDWWMFDMESNCISAAAWSTTKPMSLKKH